MRLQFTGALALIALAGGCAAERQDVALARAYGDVARRIVAAAEAGNDGWRKLEQLCDDVGHRLSGSPSLDRAIDWAAAALAADGHENVRKQPVMIPKWVRGAESVEMLAPLPIDIPMLGLGGSVGTPPAGVEAEALSVASEEDLTARASEAAGRIVLFDVPMPDDDEASGAGYGTAVRYRGAGADLAARHGAVAALVRSVTTRSMQTPHTGALRYRGDKRIPAAAITTEYAALITRLQQRGVPVRLRLKMQAHSADERVPSANVIGELVGSEKPAEVVVIGGHIDSWDVGQGAHDDGGGCVAAMEALTTLRRLGLRPRRTIRVVLFTNEENGLAGGRKYAEDYADALPNHVAAIESDSGMFQVLGYGVSCEDKQREAVAVAQLQAICDILSPLGKLTAKAGGGGADIGPMRPAGVPTLGQRVDMTHYFDYHHTPADTLDKVDPKLLTQNIAAMAVTAYVLADMPERLGSRP